MGLRIDLRGRYYPPVRPLERLTCLARQMRLWNGFCQRFVLRSAREKHEIGLVSVLDAAVLWLPSRCRPSPYP